MRKTRLLAIGLVGVLVPLALATGGLTPLAEAAVPAAATPVVSGLVLPAELTPYAGTLDLNPVANARSGSITAAFTGAARVKNRPVYLYQSTDAGLTWVRVGSKVKLSSSGKAVFKVTPDARYSYKAVAGTYTYKVKGKKRTAPLAETSPATLAGQWTVNPDFSDEFNSGALDPSKWKPTLEDEYRAGNRWCSVPKDANVTVSDGKVVLTMRRADDTTKSWVTAAARGLQKAASKKVVGCPNGVYTNARLSNEFTGRTIKTGIVAAEMTFPIYQGGHGGIWLRTANNSSGRFDEIDIVEAFGWKKGIQSVLHWGTTCSSTDDRKCETTESKKWVAKKTVGKSSWWGKSHVFSVEFTGTQVIYRIDGVVTRTDKRAMPDAEYSLVMSMLSSDYELGRLTKPVSGNKKKAKLPMSTTVNWVRTWTQA